MSQVNVNDLLVVNAVKDIEIQKLKVTIQTLQNRISELEKMVNTTAESQSVIQ